MQWTNSDSAAPARGANYSDLVSLSDAEVMAHLRCGNGDAFAVVFKRYHRLVHATALNILRDAAEAEDLTQNGVHAGGSFLPLWDIIWNIK